MTTTEEQKSSKIAEEEFKAITSWANDNMLKEIFTDQLKDMKTYVGMISLDPDGTFGLASNDFNLLFKTKLTFWTSDSLQAQIAFSIVNDWTGTEIKLCSYIVDYTFHRGVNEIIKGLDKAKHQGMEKMFKLGQTLMKFSGERCLTGSLI